MKKLIAVWLLLTALGAWSASAQPVCNPSIPSSITCQSQASNLQLTDILAGTQATGPIRANQSVKVSLSQVLNLAGSTQYLSFAGGTLTGKLTTVTSASGGAGLSVTPGSAPSSPNNGDMWTTGSGLFIRINGSTLGPLGAGGGVNAGTANAIGYYAASGNTLSAIASANNSILTTSNVGLPSFTTSLPAGLTIPGAIIQTATYPNTGSLPIVTTANEGQLAFVANCLNGSETGTGGSGCNYIVNNTGNWVPQALTPTLQITVGGQALYLGQGTVNEGNGAKLPTWTGGGVSGNCVQINATAALIDSGAPCGGGSGGSGTVTSGATNQLAWYSSSGTAVAGLASINNGVLVTSGSGVPSIATTLPSGLTIPTPTVSNPALTGAGTYVGLTGTGKLISAASTTTQAGFSVLPGSAPTSPVNGDMWSTNAGFFVRYNGGTFSLGTGNGTLTGITTPGPITGGGIAGTLTLGCATCLTSTGGGPFTVAAPLVFNGSTSILSLGNQTKLFVLNADQYTTIGNATYYVFPAFPFAVGSITSVGGLTGGTGSPSFSLSVQIAGTPIATCSGITITTASSPSSPTICGSNSISQNNPVTLVISGVNGLPSSAAVQINYTQSAS